jgi:ABC-2 type transport system permease protein
MTTTLTAPTLPDAQAEPPLKHVLSARTRPPRPSAWSASLTFGWRTVLKIKHVPMQLFDVTAFPVMMTLMFTFLFGGALAGSTVDYLQFFLPGVLVQAVVFITMYTGVALNTDISKGIFDRFRTLPIWQPSTLVGAVLGDVARYTIAGLMVVLLGLLLGFRPGGGVAGVVSAMLLLLVFSFSLSWIWTALGLVLKTPESVMGVSSMILFPLTFISNIFVDPRTMPGWLEAVVNVSPISLLVTGVRGLMHGTATADQVAWVLLASAVLIVIFGPLTMYLYRGKT